MRICCRRKSKTGKCPNLLHCQKTNNKSNKLYVSHRCFLPESVTEKQVEEMISCLFPRYLYSWALSPFVSGKRFSRHGKRWYQQIWGPLETADLADGNLARLWMAGTVRGCGRFGTRSVTYATYSLYITYKHVRLYKLILHLHMNYITFYTQFNVQFVSIEIGFHHINFNEVCHIVFFTFGSFGYLFFVKLMQYSSNYYSVMSNFDVFLNLCSLLALFKCWQGCIIFTQTIYHKIFFTW